MDETKACGTCAALADVLTDCGYTDEEGCEEGCSWVEDDLCSGVPGVAGGVRGKGGAGVSGCAHMNFKADCRITRLEDTGTFVIEVEVHCSECSEPFRFLKLTPGISTQNPCVNIDGTIATLPIEPEGAKRLFNRLQIEMPKLPEKV